MKTDLKKQIETYHARRGEFSVVQVPALDYLMIDGQGDPNSAPAYRDAVASIFPLAYAVKFFSKRSLDRDYGVMPLEALWWSPDMSTFTTARDKSRWHWTLMILLPDWITAEHVEAARDTARGKGPAVDEVRRERLDEGSSVQTLHIGPYDDEGPVLQELHQEFLPAHGLRVTGRHHEIYLSDARRTAPDKLRTILRQPVSRAPGTE